MSDRSHGRPDAADAEGNREDRPSDDRDVGSVAAAGDRFTELSTDFYRGQVDRVSTWRTRLDQTTNWAVVVMAAILTWGFSSTDNPHYVLLIGGLAMVVFLGIEAQRYQEYDAWRARVRVLEASYFAEGYSPDGDAADRWRDWLGGDLREPEVQMSLLEAAGHRLLHVYFHLLTVFIAAWGLRITVYDASATWRETASVGSAPGEAVLAGVLVVYLVLLVATAWSATRGLRREFDADLTSDTLPEDRD